ncbi:MAG: leucine-rich repeat protein [Bacilli bacterium]|nr:leucine-rich repeat protein [Bacilli bacterium]
MKASKIKLFFVRKRINEEETLDDLKIRSKLVEGKADNKFDPEAGMISHVKEDDIDYQFDGEQWKPVNKKKFVIIWVAIGAVAALAVSLSVALPIALSPRRGGTPVDPGTSQSSSDPEGSATSSEPSSNASSASQSSASSDSQSSASSASQSSASSDSQSSASSSASQSSASSSASQSSDSSASSSSSTPKTQATITFDSKGGTAVDPVTVDLNTKLAAPADPTNGDMLFGGWYLDEQPSVAGYYDFDSDVTNDFTLYAQWVQPHIYELDEYSSDPLYNVGENDEYHEQNVVVPGVYKGVKVAIGDDFYTGNNSEIKTVVIEEGLEVCGLSAFRNCTELESVTFPSTIKEFQEESFSYYSPTKLHIPASVEYIGSFAFGECPNLTELTFEDSKNGLVLTEDNFRLGQFTSVTLPEGLTEVGYDCFTYTNNLKTVFLPSTLKKTRADVFGDSLEKVYSKVSKDDLELVEDYSCKLFSLDWYLYAEDGLTPANQNGYFYYYNDDDEIVEMTVDTNPITISFHSDGGSEVAALNPAFGEVLALPSPTKEGYAFDAWYTSENPGYMTYVREGTKAINSMELYAHWVDGKIIVEPNPYREGAFDLIGSQEDIVNAVVPNVYHGNRLDLYKSGAFKNRLSLKSVTYEGTGDIDDWIPIESETFSGCTSLEYVVLEGRLQYLGKDAFKDCTSLTKIYEKVPYVPGHININPGNEAFEAATRYKFTANGAAETGSGNWWYYDAGHNIVEVINA